jgi:anti-sigma B factor antagonist
VGSRIELDLGDPGDTYSVIAASGELDLSTASLFADSLRRAYDGPAGGVLVDLTDCGFIDSTGVSLLLNACRRQTRAREGIAVVCPNPTPRRVFEITGTLDTLNVVADMTAGAEAIERSRDKLAQAPSE